MESDAKLALEAAAHISQEHAYVVKQRLESLQAFTDQSRDSDARQRMSLSPAAIATRRSALGKGPFAHNTFKEYVKRLTKFKKSLTAACDRLEACQAEE